MNVQKNFWGLQFSLLTPAKQTRLIWIWFILIVFVFNEEKVSHYTQVWKGHYYDINAYKLKVFKRIKVWTKWVTHGWKWSHPPFLLKINKVIILNKISFPLISLYFYFFTSYIYLVFVLLSHHIFSSLVVSYIYIFFHSREKSGKWQN